MTSNNNDVQVDLQEELIRCLEENREDRLVDILCSSDVDVNYAYSYPHRRSCLHQAVESQNELAIRFLLNRGADCEVKDRALKTPLHHAIECLYVSGVKILLENGANVNAKDKLNRNCVHMAVLGFNKEPAVSEDILKAVLEISGVALNDLDCSQSSPLLLAARAGAWNLCSLLLKKGADIDCSSFGSESARELISVNSPELLSLATEKVVPDPAQQLFEVLSSNNLNKFVELLDQLKKHEDPSVVHKALNQRQGQRTPLEHSTAYGMDLQAIALIRAGAELDMSTPKYSYNPYQGACAHGNNVVLSQLVRAAKKQGIQLDPNQPHHNNETLMNLIARNASDSNNKCLDGYVSCAEILLRSSPAPNVLAYEDLGFTPIHYAARMEDQRIFRLLLAHVSANSK